MRKNRYLTSVRSALPEGVQADLDRALAGDALAARRLMIIAPRRLRGHIACLAYQLKTRNPAYREIIKAVWAREARHLLTAHWPPQMVRRMLTRAAFPIPELSGTLTLYRPVTNAETLKAAAALAWFLSREAAAAEAARSGAAQPRILQAAVDASDIIYWGNSRGEQEVVSRCPPQAIAAEPTDLPRGASRPLTSSRHR
jgi:hypothetical protein